MRAARRRPDVPSVVAGFVLTALGVLLLLAQTGWLELRFAYAAPAVLAAVGTVLLVTGLSRD